MEKPAIGLQSIHLAPLNKENGSVLFDRIKSDSGDKFPSITFYTIGSANMFAFDDMAIGANSQMIHNNNLLGTPHLRSLDIYGEDPRLVPLMS